MRVINLLVIIVCVLLFLSGFILEKGAALYWNRASLIFVLSGTTGAAFISYSFSRIKFALIVVKNAYFKKLPTETRVVMSLLDFSLKSRYEGLLAMEDTIEKAATPFLQDAMRMLVDGRTGEEIKDFLNIEMTFFRQRREQNERVFRAMAITAPAFGLIGSVIGLMGMLVGIGDVGVIVRTIPVALTSTLYGILFNSFCLTPIAEKIHSCTQEELLLQKLIMSGAIAISNAQNPYVLEKKLSSFLAPSVRLEIERNFKEIRKQYLKVQWENKEQP
ncbi:MAG: MotA/TolQ/ExbB proton channel family protein [Nitrospirae bacterium]|nr:MotA/TolQ/ExbB proton channel family protein [Candidatus Troglogloeales bacterium]